MTFQTIFFSVISDMSTVIVVVQLCSVWRRPDASTFWRRRSWPANRGHCFGISTFAVRLLPRHRWIFQRWSDNDASVYVFHRAGNHCDAPNVYTLK